MYTILKDRHGLRPDAGKPEARDIRRHLQSDIDIRRVSIITHFDGGSV
jgi:hypothetical protein